MRYTVFSLRSTRPVAPFLALCASLLVAGCQSPEPAPSPTLEPTGTLAVTPTSSPTLPPTQAPTATVSPTLPPTAAPTPTATAPASSTPPAPTLTPVDTDLDNDGYSTSEGDCDDADPNQSPGTLEQPYDGIDQDCSGSDLVDVDGDGYTATQADGDDCDDTATTIHPGAEEFEDDRDNDCDGFIDEALNTTDDDGDGYSEATGDCDDADPTRAPELEDVPYDGIDQDCSGSDLRDQDGDGYPGGSAGTDCDDLDPTRNPGAAETPYDGIDQSCDGADLTDQDQDGVSGGPDGSDCDDLDPARSPLLSDVPYDGIDQDCTGSDLVDVDGDGQASTQAGGTDCNDQSTATYQGAAEVPYDTVDQDCNGSDLIDVDGDGHPALQAGGDDCDDTNQSTFPGAPEFEDDKDNDCNGQVDDGLNTNDDDGDGFSEATGDCNDANGGIFPGAVELPYDGIDQDCSGQDLTDVDGDGFAGGGGSDCNDQELSIYPGAAEVPYDGIDQDCTSLDLVDVDGDGYDSEAVGGDDCDDSEGLIHPDASEVPYDAIDQDCDSLDLTDVDGDGFDSTQVGGNDCNDASPGIKPDATELCDGFDNNCDGVVDSDAQDRLTFYLDGDADTYGDPAQASLGCAPSPVQVSNSLDCNDASAISYPGAAEVCDHLDNNCDTMVDENVTQPYFADADGDTFGDANALLQDCEAPEGYVEDFTDCDDDAETTYPGAPELCNGIDDSCDDAIDEGVLTLYYLDEDGDGFGLTSTEKELCEAPEQHVTVSGDCDDTRALVNPEGQEVCDALNLDEDCDGFTDDADTSVDAATKATWYRDADGDLYGSSTVTTQACDAPSGYVAQGGDCNASNPAIYPGASEGPGDSVDQNCDGLETCFADNDDDGFRPNATATTNSSDKDCLDAFEAASTDPTTDCNDSDAAIKPGATETAGDSIDQDCSGTETCFKDSDNDGYRPDTSSTVPSSDSDCMDANEAVSADPTTDCNDSDAAIKPGATETAGDSVDQDCSGTETCFKDADNDGYRPDATSTTASSDTDCADASEAISTDPTTDCNDSDAAIKPGATEIAGDSVDQDCSGTETCFKDADNDGYRPDVTSTTASSDTDCSDANEATSTDPTTDCNDANAAIKPGATEIAGDSIDQDCSGTETCFKDFDNDGYRPDATSTTSSSDADCADASEAVSTDPATDCNDADPAIKPGATELVGDSVDQDCSGTETCFKDFDNDGYRPDATSTTASTDTDCADANEAISTDPTTDCNDGDAAIKPGATELVGDSVDQDCSGTEICFRDADNDGYRPDATSTTASSDTDCADANEATNSDPTNDCNDSNASIKPGASEVADGVDQNCNGSIDEGLNQTSCLTLKQNVPSSASGIYTIDPDGSGSGAPFQVYCDMTTAGGGWTLFTNRRGNSTNVETCGANLMEFQGSPCGSVTAIGYSNSYSLSTGVMMRIAFTQYLVIQYDSSGTADTDDAYILYSSQNLFPTTNAVQQIPVSKVCDMNGNNCDTSSVYWKFIGDFWYHSSMCYSGSSYNSTYRGNYGLCADGASDSGNASSYPSSGKYGNREEYNETKLWAHPNNAAAYQERIFVR